MCELMSKGPAIFFVGDNDAVPSVANDNDFAYVRRVIPARVFYF